MGLNLGCALESLGRFFFSAAAWASRDLDSVGVGMAQAPNCSESSPGDGYVREFLELQQRCEGSVGSSRGQV